MRILVAMDKFRGTLTAADACDAVARGLAGAAHATVCLPLSDGGEGFVEALGGANRESKVTGPQGIPVRAHWRLDGSRAVIESALACGLALRDDTAPWDPLQATSRGVGELIGAALDAGAGEIWVGVGGTGCTDGGAGAIEALATWLKPGIPAALTVLTDVTTHFPDAARVFGPQKGARPAEVVLLTERLERLARTYAQRFGRRIDAVDGAGAGGGLAGGLAAIGGEIRSGFDTIAAAIGFDNALAAADLVITGEGRFDAQSLRGKVVGGVLARARAAGTPALVIAGDTEPGAVRQIEADDEVLAVHSLVADCGAHRAWNDAAAALAETAAAAAGSG